MKGGQRKGGGRRIRVVLLFGEVKGLEEGDGNRGGLLDFFLIVLGEVRDLREYLPSVLNIERRKLQRNYYRDWEFGCGEDVRTRF